MSAARVEPSWMAEGRDKAKARFQSMKWPQTSEERWRRTDVSRLSLESFTASSNGYSAAGLAATPREVDCGPNAGILRFDAGRCTECALSGFCKERGVRLLPLSLALEEFENPLRALFTERLEGLADRFAAWHAWTWSHGAFLFVPRGVEVPEPFLVEMTETGSGLVCSPHVTVVLEEGARASVVQRLLEAESGSGAAGQGLLCNAGIDLSLGPASGLKYFEEQKLGRRSLYFRGARARVEKDASFSGLEVSLGGRIVKTDAEALLNGRGADVHLRGLYFCGRDQHMDIASVQRHNSPSASSRAFYKGAVDSGGRTVFQGLIEVATGASGTDAFLSNRNLILGDAARADSIPTLKIGNNDVKCSHGSTTGRLSDEELFYLESRGLSQVEAREMLVTGYFEELLADAPEGLRESTIGVVRQRLQQAA